MRGDHGEVHDWADSTLICSLGGISNLSNTRIIMLYNLPTLLLDVKSFFLSWQHHVEPLTVVLPPAQKSQAQHRQ